MATDPKRSYADDVYARLFGFEPDAPQPPLRPDAKSMPYPELEEGTDPPTAIHGQARAKKRPEDEFELAQDSAPIVGVN